MSSPTNMTYRGGGCPGFRWVALGLLALFLLPVGVSSMTYVGAWMFDVTPPQQHQDPAVAVSVTTDGDNVTGMTYGFDGHSIVVPWLGDSLAYAGLSEAQQRRAIMRWSRAMRNFELHRYGQAAEQFTQIAEALPTSTMRTGAYYNAACAHAKLGEKRPATLLLAKAIREGFRDARLIEMDEDLAAIRDEPLYRYLIKLCQEQRFQELDELNTSDLRKRFRSN